MEFSLSSSTSGLPYAFILGSYFGFWMSDMITYLTYSFFYQIFWLFLGCFLLASFAVEYRSHNLLLLSILHWNVDFFFFYTEFLCYVQLTNSRCIYSVPNHLFRCYPSSELYIHDLILTETFSAFSRTIGSHILHKHYGLPLEIFLLA